MTAVLILGAGGTGRDVMDWLPELRAAGRPLEVLGFLDDDPAKRGLEIGGAKVLGPLTDIVRFPDASIIDALGSPRSYRGRPKLVAAFPDSRAVTVVHPLARVSSRAVIGAGSIIYPFAFIGPDVVLGRHVVVLSHGSLNHDVRIGDFAILASHVSLGGGATIGRACYLGMRATVREGIQVGDGALVGMGAVVTDDVPAGVTVVGMPARPLGSA